MLSTKRKSKNENIMGEDSPSYWKSPPKCITNMTKFLMRAKAYAHLINEDVLLVDMQELQEVEKKVCETL